MEDGRALKAESGKRRKVKGERRKAKGGRRKAEGERRKVKGERRKVKGGTRMNTDLKANRRLRIKQRLRERDGNATGLSHLQWLAGKNATGLSHLQWFVGRWGFGLFAAWLILLGLLLCLKGWIRGCRFGGSASGNNYRQ